MLKITTLLITLAFGLRALSTNAQDIPLSPNLTDSQGKKQGKWTILYDENWEEIKNPQKTEFYRVLNYKDDKPIGKVIDYYKTGIPQMEADAVISENPKKYNGKVTFYSESGAIININFYFNGFLDINTSAKLLEKTIANKYQDSPKNLDYAYAISNLGLKYVNLGLLSKAEPLLLESKTIIKEKRGTDNFKYVKNINNLALLYQTQRQDKKAQLLFLEIKHIMLKLYGRDNIDYATICNNLGLTYKNLNSFQKAIELYKEAMDIYEKISETNNINYASTINNLAALYFSQGLFEKAEPIYLKSKDIHFKISGKNTSDYATLVYNLGTLYLEQGKTYKAAKFLNEAKEIQLNVFGKNSLDYALTLFQLANLVFLKGNYQESEDLLTKSRNIYLNTLGKSNPYYTEASYQLAIVYIFQGLIQKAEDLLQEIRGEYSKQPQKENLLYLDVLGFLLSIYKSKKQPQKAKQLITQIEKLQFDENIDNIDSFFKANMLLVTYHLYKREYQKAEKLLIKIKEMLEKKSVESQLLYSQVYISLATIYEEQELYQKAEQYISRAKEIVYKHLGKKQILYLVSCLLSAKNFYNQEKYPQAISAFEEVHDIIRFQISDNLNHLSEREKTNTLSFLNNYTRLFPSIVLKAQSQYPSLISKLYNNILTFKGLIFQSTKKMRERILNSNDQTLKNKFRNWQDKREFIAKAYGLSKQNLEKREINLKKLEDELNNIEKELSLSASKLEGLKGITGSLLGDKKDYTWLDIQKRLKPGEAAIEILRTQYRAKQAVDSIMYIALIIKSDTKDHPEMLVLPNGNELEGRYFSQYRNAIKYQRSDQISYEIYWKKIAEKTQGIKKIYFSPDGIYHQINLNTLKNTETNKFLLEELDIYLVGNTKYLINNSLPVSQSPNNAILLGRPDYDLEVKQHLASSMKFNSLQRGKFSDFYNVTEELVDVEFSDLPGTEKEVLNIQKKLLKKGWKVKTYLGKDALEEVVKKSNSPRVLHIATHGFFLEDFSSKKDTSYSVVESDDLEIDLSEVLKQTQNTNSQITQPNKTNPMLRSGIVLAGVSTFAKSKQKYQAEDGILTAFEAMNLNLDNTELLVLSACETGKGDIKNGEGVYGLQRGFQTAGVRSILMSLWDVSDQATQELMTEFYKLWLENNDKRKAFKKAQLKIKEKYKYPYFWGAFIMIGE